jgi:hypothetical protein
VSPSIAVLALVQVLHAAFRLCTHIALASLPMSLKFDALAPLSFPVPR